MSEFLRQSMMIFIIQGFWTIVFIFVIFTSFWPTYPPTLFRLHQYKCVYLFLDFLIRKFTFYVKIIGVYLFMGKTIFFSLSLYICPGDLGSIPGRVIPKTLKMVLDTSLLNTQQYKVLIKDKVEQSPLHRSSDWSSYC